MSVDVSFDYKSIPTQQVKNYFSIFSNFFSLEKFDFVIEIGTSYGGLSLFLHEQSQIYNFEFYTFDISEKRLNKYWSDKKIPFTYFIDDCFSEQSFEKIIEILSNKKTLLLCDGGDKIREFNTFSKYLKSGSFIMAHDYSPDRDYFNEKIKDKTWNWCEIKDSDIQESFQFVKKSIHYSDFLGISWLSCIKE